MTDELTAAYPEAAEIIWDAVAEHGEEWVVDNYYVQIYPLGVVMAVPEKAELPFFDAEKHETMSQAELTDMYEGWAEHRENLRSGTKTTQD